MNRLMPVALMCICLLSAGCSGKLSFEGRLLCRTFSCFVSCLLGGLPSRSRLLGRPALRNPDLSRGDNGFLAAWRSVNPGSFSFSRCRCNNSFLAAAAASRRSGQLGCRNHPS